MKRQADKYILWAYRIAFISFTLLLKELNIIRESYFFIGFFILGSLLFKFGISIPGTQMYITFVPYLIASVMILFYPMIGFWVLAGFLLDDIFRNRYILHDNREEVLQKFLINGISHLLYFVIIYNLSIRTVPFLLFFLLVLFAMFLNDAIIIFFSKMALKYKNNFVLFLKEDIIPYFSWTCYLTLVYALRDIMVSEKYIMVYVALTSIQIIIVYEYYRKFYNEQKLGTLFSFLHSSIENYDLSEILKGFESVLKGLCTFSSWELYRMNCDNTLYDYKNKVSLSFEEMPCIKKFIKLKNIDVKSFFGSNCCKKKCRNVVLVSSNDDKSWILSLFDYRINANFYDRKNLEMFLMILLSSAATLIEKVELREEIINQSKLEPLTNLLHKKAFYEKFQNEIYGIKQKNRRSVLYFIDINDFKVINDVNGHLYGDKILCEVAMVLKENVRPYDIVGRFGGDEFVIFCPSFEGDPEIFSTRIQEVLYSNLNIYISIGWAVFPEDGLNFEELIKIADSRMYFNKRLLKNTQIL